MTTVSRNPPLANELHREASDTMRGYSYKIVQSVFAWTELSESEVLYLEDFDIVSGEGAAAQVKDTVGSGNISLSRDGVVSAINNYWSLRNPNGRIAAVPGRPFDRTL